MTRKTKEDRPGWKYYQARVKVDALVDAVILESFKTCRDEGCKVCDTHLQSKFLELRDAAERLSRLLSLRETYEVHAHQGRNR